MIGALGAICWWLGVEVALPRHIGDPAFYALSACYVVAAVWQGRRSWREYRAASVDRPDRFAHRLATSTA